MWQGCPDGIFFSNFEQLTAFCLFTSTTSRTLLEACGKCAFGVGSADDCAGAAVLTTIDNCMDGDDLASI